MTNKSHYKSSTTVPVDRMVTYLEGYLPIKSNVPLITCPFDPFDPFDKLQTFPLLQPMGTKLGRLVTYLKGLLPIKFCGF